MANKYDKPDCDANFGDHRCQKPNPPRVGVISAIIDDKNFVASGFLSPERVGFFYFGKISIHRATTSTAEFNQIKRYDPVTNIFTLKQPFSDGALSVGDTFTAFQGCDGKYMTCRDLHRNIVNFRGNPFLPGQKPSTDKPWELP